MSPQLSDFKAVVFDVYGTLCVRWIFPLGPRVILTSLTRIIGLGNRDVQRVTTLDIPAR